MKLLQSKVGKSNIPALYSGASTKTTNLEARSSTIKIFATTDFFAALDQKDFDAAREAYFILKDYKFLDALFTFSDYELNLAFKTFLEYVENKDSTQALELYTRILEKFPYVFEYVLKNS